MFALKTRVGQLHRNFLVGYPAAVVVVVVFLLSPRLISSTLPLPQGFALLPLLVSYPVLTVFYLVSLGLLRGVVRFSCCFHASSHPRPSPHYRHFIFTLTMVYGRLICPCVFLNQKSGAITTIFIFNGCFSSRL